MIFRRESPNLKSTLRIEFRRIRLNLLSGDLLDCVNPNGFAPAFLAYAMQVNDGYAVTDFEHVGLGCGCYYLGLSIDLASFRKSIFREFKNGRGIIRFRLAFLRD